MNVVGLLTGRGNNTLKDKNLLLIDNKPVLYYISNAGKKAKTLNDWYASSDDDMILNLANEMGYKKIKRPKELATPEAQHIDCILHAMKAMKQDGVEPDILVVLLANNVTVNSQWIDDCVNILIENPTATAVVPVYNDNDHHPLRAKSISEDGTLSMYTKENAADISTNRQQLPKCYFLAHNFWVIRTSCIEDNIKHGQIPWKFLGDKIYPYVIEESIDIHTDMDLVLAEQWIKKNYNN